MPTAKPNTANQKITRTPGHLQDNGVCDVAAGDENIATLSLDLVPDGIIIGEDEQRHVGFIG